MVVNSVKLKTLESHETDIVSEETLRLQGWAAMITDNESVLTLSFVGVFLCVCGRFKTGPVQYSDYHGASDFDMNTFMGLHNAIHLFPLVESLFVQ